MTNSRKVAIAAWLDPLHAATWSGTALNVSTALKAAGIDVITLKCRPSLLKVLPAHAVHRLIGQDVGYTRRKIGRRECTRMAKSLPSDCVGILHMSSVTVPPRGSTPGVRHFLLCDSMADYWRNYAPDELYLTRRQFADYEEDERRAVSATDHFFPTAEHVASNLKLVYGVNENKITVVGTGRGKIAPLQGAKDYSKKNILMVAKQRFEDKGGPLLINALQIARSVDPDLNLTLVSPESFRHYVGGAKGISFPGTVSWSELQRLFDEACLYAMPALCEPWGLVYAEALATKTPILGLDRAALREITNGGKFGFLVKEASPQAVAKALLEAVADPERLRAMGEAGQKYCLETFTWERTAHKIVSTIFQ